MPYGQIEFMFFPRRRKQALISAKVAEIKACFLRYERVLFLFFTDCEMPNYIHEHDSYPAFTWNAAEILDPLARAAALQGKILGAMRRFGFDIQRDAMLNAMTEEIVKSSEIEGEILNSEQVRSSLARRLNIRLRQSAPPSHHIDGMVESMVDAVENHTGKLTKKRLFGWHAALFPTGWSGMSKIRVGKFRDVGMQIVSIKRGREVVHYQAPPARNVPAQMGAFLDWLNKDPGENPLIKTAVAHLWFVIIHPFDDGNGRLARVITEMMLARAENSTLRFYSMSAQIQREKKEYYRVLEATTTGDPDITLWLKWFFSCLARALENSEHTIEKILCKAGFWQKNALKIFNETERKILNLLLDGFDGNLTSGKVAKICKVSQDTATRLLQNLAANGLLRVQGAGRGTHYVLNPRQ